MEAIAKTRHLKGSPRKARLVIDLIRGRNVSQALNILKFTNKRAADPIAKTLRSAIANATNLAEQQNIAIDPDDLFVKTCFVDMGVHKHRSRMRPAPQGRAFREQRHYCHITILVSSDVPKKEESDKSRVKGKKLLAKEAAEAAAATTQKTAKTPSKTKKASKVSEVKEETTIPVMVQDPVAQMEKTAPGKNIGENTPPKIAHETTKVKNDAEASDAKNTTTQFDAELNESKSADEAQLDRNEELERQ
ncbi:MAG: 50S ribosomal protein L22 [Acidobacteria bacterium]|jgi:large subunit ribosomal protein L22|nr:50S ribosomal protein L22 [Acidobacteriota bacterium]